MLINNFNKEKYKMANTIRKTSKGFEFDTDIDFDSYDYSDKKFSCTLSSRNNDLVIITRKFIGYVYNNAEETVSFKSIGRGLKNFLAEAINNSNSKDTEFTIKENDPDLYFGKLKSKISEYLSLF